MKSIEWNKNRFWCFIVVFLIILGFAICSRIGSSSYLDNSDLQYIFISVVVFIIISSISYYTLFWQIQYDENEFQLRKVHGQITIYYDEIIRVEHFIRHSGRGKTDKYRFYVKREPVDLIEEETCIECSGPLTNQNMEWFEFLRTIRHANSEIVFITRLAQMYNEDEIYPLDIDRTE